MHICKHESVIFKFSRFHSAAKALMMTPLICSKPSSGLSFPSMMPKRRARLVSIWALKFKTALYVHGFFVLVVDWSIVMQIWTFWSCAQKCLRIAWQHFAAVKVWKDLRRPPKSIIFHHNLRPYIFWTSGACSKWLTLFVEKTLTTQFHASCSNYLQPL